MYIKSNLLSEDWRYVHPKLTSDGKTASADMFYHIDAAFRILSIRVDHSSEEEYFCLETAAPDFSIFTSMGKKEADEHVKTGMHQHDFFELLYVAEGTVFQIIENQRHLYPKGSFCLLNRNTRHTEEYSTDFKVYFLQISERFMESIFRDMDLQFFSLEQKQAHTKLYSFLMQNLGDTPSGKEYIDFIPVNPDDSSADQSLILVRKLFEELTQPRIGSSYAIKHLCCQLMFLLKDSSLYHTKPVVIGTEIENKLFQQIGKLMEETNGRIARKELEEQLHYSGVYLNRIIKKNIRACRFSIME